MSGLPGAGGLRRVRGVTANEYRVVDLRHEKQTQKISSWMVGFKLTLCSNNSSDSFNGPPS